MISPVGMTIAAMTVMLWILWSDTIRAKRPTPILYAFRIATFLIVTGVLILNLVRYPAQFSGSARIFVVITSLVGLLGAGYFTRRLVTRS